MSFINTRPFRLLFVGRPVVEKGLNDLLLALSMVASFDWTLTIVGELPPINDIPEILSVLHSENVRCIGAVNNSRICELLNQHDILIVPSHYENFGNIVIEAMACGKAIIAAKTGGLKGLIRDHHNGLHCIPKDPQDLAAKLKMIFEDPELIDTLGAEAIVDARQYAWPSVLRATLILFNQYL